MFTLSQQSFFSLLAILGLGYGILQTRFYHQRFKTFSASQEERTTEAVFYERQARRRMQMGALTTITGISLLGGTFIPPKQYILFFTLSWFLVIGFLCWTIALAVVDMISIQLFYTRIERQNMAGGLKMPCKTQHHKAEDNQETNQETTNG